MSAGYPLTEWEVNQHGFDQFPPSAQVKTCPHCDVRFVDTDPLSVGPALRLEAHISQQHSVPVTTPTPWIFDGIKVGPASTGVYTDLVATGQMVALVYGTGRGDGRLIVRAVNSHEPMLAALKVTLEYWESTGFADCDEGCDCIVDSVRAAIALAEGR